MFLVIGEKPSVSQALAKILKAGKKEDGYLSGEDCLVSWCFGHLAEYAPPESYDGRYAKWTFSDLPIIPEEWKLTVAKDKKAQLAVLKKLLNRKDLEYVVNACDAGREGELIFKHVYDLSGSTLPVKRLWISSMEDSAIREGFTNLKDGKEYRDICEASVCRAKADWRWAGCRRPPSPCLWSVRKKSGVLRKKSILQSIFPAAGWRQCQGAWITGKKHRKCWKNATAGRHRWYP